MSNKASEGSINGPVKMMENHTDISNYSYDSDMIYVHVLSKAPYESDDEYLPPCPRSNLPLLCVRGWLQQQTILVETEDNDHKKQDSGSSHSNVEFEVEADEYFEDEAPSLKRGRFHFEDGCCLVFDEL
jgi:hypothetical protein